MVKKIENYYLEEVVGEGEYGKVYKATNERTNELVAIKVIKIEKFKMSPKLEECTINEIQTLSKIQSNEHVVKFMEILKTVNNYYFVYEYCNGGTLEKMIRQEEFFHESKALMYFADMLKAFKTLTKYNIMHRDIKPGNILLHNGVIKIADFGFCKPLGSSKDLAQTMLGSPIYMAPEILRGQVYTIKADIWSLGVVLYQMLFGFCPFEQKSIAKLVTLLEEGTLSFPRSKNNISARTEELLRRMLVKDHFKRISWEELFEWDLGQMIKPRLSLERKMGDSGQNRLEPAMGLQPQPLGSVSNNLTTNFSKKAPYDAPFKKTLSQNDTGDKSLVGSLINCRSKLQTGFQLITDLLTNYKGKNATLASCILMNKVKQIAEYLDKQLKKSQVDKENQREKSYQVKKTTAILKEEIAEVRQRAKLFEQERSRYSEDERQVFEGLREEYRDKTSYILEFWDYLKTDCNLQPYEKKDYSILSREYLESELTRRIRG